MYLLAGDVGYISYMNQNAITENTARNTYRKLNLRLAVTVDKRLEYINSILHVLNESRSGAMHSDVFLGSYDSFSEAEAEVGSLESDVLFRPSWTAYSKFIPAAGSVSVYLGEGRGVSETSISSFANLASLGETGFFNAKIAKDAKKRKDLDAVFGTSILEVHQLDCPATGPPSK